VYIIGCGFYIEENSQISEVYYNLHNVFRSLIYYFSENAQ